MMLAGEGLDYPSALCGWLAGQHSEGTRVWGEMKTNGILSRNVSEMNDVVVSLICFNRTLKWC